MMPKTFKPILLHTSHMNVLVVGYGKIGKRKTNAYFKTGANVTVVAPNATCIEPGIAYYPMAFSSFFENHSAIFNQQHLILICTDNEAVNEAVQKICEENYKLFNRTDFAEKSLYSDMLYAQGEYHLHAVSGSGFSPYISKYILSNIGHLLVGPKLKERIKVLYHKTPFLKSHHIPYDEIESLDNETIERM